MDRNRVITRHWKNKVLQDERQLNYMTSEVKEQILELSKSSKEKTLKSVEKTSSEESELETNEEIEKIEWIMCDECLKWRKISCEEAQKFYGNKKWFCSMNKSYAFNQCFAPEECDGDLIKMIHRKHLKLVILGLQCGDLVWAKFSSFLKWPAFISCDPVNGEFVFGEPSYETMYHVEFLGSKHSHNWVKGFCIELYSESDTNNLLSTKTSIKKKLKNHRSLKQYHHLQYAIKEANTLINLSNSERMKYCVFKHVNNTAIATSHPAEYRCKDYRKFPIKQSENRTHYKTDSTLVQLCPKPNRHLFENNHGNSQNFNGETISSGMSRYSNDTEIKSSLLSLTSQQRLHFDIQVYKKNEIAFTVDLKQFLARNNLHLETTYWENVPVNSYQLFQAVNEFGGYEKVSQKSKWSSIYQEITHTNVRYRGTLARNFYYRNLYAFSLYLLKKDYDYVIQDILRQDKKTNKNFVLEKPLKKSQKIQSSSADNLFGTFYEKLEELENVNKMCYFEEEIKSAEKELGIAIHFHDEPTPVSSLLEYKSPLADPAFADNCHELITEGLQVPDIFSFESCSDSYSTNNDISQSELDNESLNIEDLNILKEQIEFVSCQIDL